MTSYASIVEFTHMADIGKRASAQCGSYILISHIMFIEIDILSKKERKRLSGADLGAPLFGHPTRSHRLRRTPIHRGLRLAPSPLHYILSLSSAYYLLFLHVFSRSWCGERTLSVLPSHQASSSVISTFVTLIYQFSHHTRSILS